MSEEIQHIFIYCCEEGCSVWDVPFGFTHLQYSQLFKPFQLKPDHTADSQVVSGDHWSNTEVR